VRREPEATEGSLSRRGSSTPFIKMPTIEQHFDRADPAVRAVYETILNKARGYGPVVDDPKRTSLAE